MNMEKFFESVYKEGEYSYHGPHIGFKNFTGYKQSIKDVNYWTTTTDDGNGPVMSQHNWTKNPNEAIHCLISTYMDFPDKEDFKRESEKCLQEFTFYHPKFFGESKYCFAWKLDEELYFFINKKYLEEQAEMLAE